MENYRTEQELTDNLSLKKGIKKVGKGIKKTASKAVGTKKSRTAVKKKVGTAVKKVTNVAGNAALLPLMPFMVAMKAALRKKGFDTSKMDNKTVVIKFHNEVVSKKGNAKSSLEPVDESKYYELPQWKMSPEEWASQDNLIDDIVNIVSDIISFFKKSKETVDEIKKSGKDPKTQVTDTIAEAAKATDLVLLQLEEKEKASTPVVRGDFPGAKPGLGNATIFGGLGIVIIIVIIIIAIK